ncbi:nucleoside triphosphate pyrophosphohydrolase [Psychrobacter sp. HD31]|uniref:nucleoside triphosphate pyrophosphohydrolase n=1 Tax=Psychrobacter sp. HD31 TaxID=3112003 RepID=UPI003DA4DD55
MNVLSPQPTLLNPPYATGDMADLLVLMARLRQDCPWDIKQTNKSLIPYAIEEVYELVEAIQQDYADGHKDDEDVKSELGDVLLQIVFHTQIYAEQGRFGLNDVIQSLQEKLIRRHPHVFDKQNLPDEEAVKKRWDEIKAEENAKKQARGKFVSKLDKVKTGSALMQAQALQKYAGKLGFDWDDIADAVDKLEEEIAELKEILPNKSQSNRLKLTEAHKAEVEKELGDCMFGLVNIARKLDIDAEKAALTCTHKFRSRFAYIERELAKNDKTPEMASLEEMDRLWEQAKSFEK